MCSMASFEYSQDALLFHTCSINQTGKVEERTALFTNTEYEIDRCLIKDVWAPAKKSADHYILYLECSKLP